jgi:HEAT repeat protein
VTPEPRELLADLASGDEARAESAVPLLAALGGAILPDLIELLGTQNRDQRWWATRALAALGGDGAVSALERALQDPEPEVRQCAALGLRHHPAASAIRSLAAALSDPDRMTARLAGDALIAVGPRATPDLIEVVAQAGPAAKIEAVRALAAIGDQRSIPALYALLEDPSALVQHWAEEALERMGVGMVYFKP